MRIPAASNRCSLINHWIFLSSSHTKRGRRWYLLIIQERYRSRLLDRRSAPRRRTPTTTPTQRLQLSPPVSVLAQPPAPLLATSLIQCQRKYIKEFQQRAVGAAADTALTIHTSSLRYILLTAYFAAASNPCFTPLAPLTTYFTLYNKHRITPIAHEYLGCSALRACAYWGKPERLKYSLYRHSINPRSAEIVLRISCFQDRRYQEWALVAIMAQVALANMIECSRLKC